jgi:hypothetical protein
VIVSHAHRFIFLKTRKTGGSSVEVALSSICGPDDVLTPMTAEEEELRQPRNQQNRDVPSELQPKLGKLLVLLGGNARTAGAIFYGHMPAARVKRALPPEVWDNYKKVTIERNPWDRELSHYFWRNPQRGDPEDFERFVLRRSRPRRIDNFDIYSIGGKVVADIVLRYESLASDFAVFAHGLGLTTVPELPKAKGSSRPLEARDYRPFYNDRTRDFVARRYSREIEAFGYVF